MRGGLGAARGEEDGEEESLPRLMFTKLLASCPATAISTLRMPVVARRGGRSKALLTSVAHII